MIECPSPDRVFPTCGRVLLFASAVKLLRNTYSRALAHGPWSPLCGPAHSPASSPSTSSSLSASEGSDGGAASSMSSESGSSVSGGEGGL